MATGADGRAYRDPDKIRALNDAIRRGNTGQQPHRPVRPSSNPPYTAGNSSSNVIVKNMSRAFGLAAVLFMFFSCVGMFNKNGSKTEVSRSNVATSPQSNDGLYYQAGMYQFNLQAGKETSWIKFPADKSSNFKIMPNSANYMVVFNDGSEYPGNISLPSKSGSNIMMKIRALNNAPSSVTFEISYKIAKKAKKAKKADLNYNSNSSIPVPAQTTNIESPKALFNKGNAIYANDPGKATQFFIKSAERGYVKAQRRLGGLYYAGKGVAQNFGEAAKWYKLAAENNDSDAQYFYGMMLTKGIGTDRNIDAGKDLIKQAADRGNLDAKKVIAQRENNR